MGERSLSLDATEFAHEVVLQRLPALPNRQVHVVVQFAVLVQKVLPPQSSDQLRFRNIVRWHRRTLEVFLLVRFQHHLGSTSLRIYRVKCAELELVQAERMRVHGLNLPVGRSWEYLEKAVLRVHWRPSFGVLGVLLDVDHEHRLRANHFELGLLLVLHRRHEVEQHVSFSRPLPLHEKKLSRYQTCSMLPRSRLPTPKP
mmetsp:Transcript_12511/g.29570  ORF Transcript_12511/g.29570 Transcript_12511/m.29570 type:complete len:200 (-) Transcript_12511:6-605(-)